METNGNLDLGNTKTKSRVVPSKYWCFTLNNWTEVELQEILEIMETGKYIIGKEIGQEGTPHLQGYYESDKKIRPLEKFKTTRIHWEKRNGTREDNIKYCSKENNFITNFKIPKKIKDPLEGYEPYEWQLLASEILEDPVNDRVIYWFWDREGCKGKTSWCKHICLSKNAIMLSGKGADIKNGVISHIEKHKELDVAIFHFTRTVEDYISYEAIESVKDGIFFSGKYESSMVMFNSPHIICLANFEPDRTKMSMDRWVVSEINDVVE